MSVYPTESKAVVFLLTADETLVPSVIAAFEKMLGPVEMQGNWHPFESHYYDNELGSNPKRCLIGFKNIFEPHRLPKLKNLSRKLEKKMKRKINIDPGIVDLFKVVLVSGKGGGQKVALTKNCYAYTLLRYEKEKWLPFDWTYPDFKAPFYHADLLTIRKSLKIFIRCQAPHEN